MASITALFNQKHSPNVICVGYFTFNRIRSRPTAPPTDLNSLRNGRLDPGEASLLPLHVLLLFTLSHTEHIILYNLNAAIQKSESNQHSDKTLLQE